MQQLKEKRKIKLELERQMSDDQDDPILKKLEDRELFYA